MSLRKKKTTSEQLDYMKLNFGLALSILVDILSDEEFFDEMHKMEFDNHELEKAYGVFSVLASHIAEKNDKHGGNIKKMQKKEEYFLYEFEKLIEQYTGVKMDIYDKTRS